MGSPKRQLFSGIQASHGINIRGAIPQPVRTGYDTVIAHRVDRKFAWVAKEDGVVVEKTNKHIAVKYNSGKIDRTEIGTIYGVSTGKVINNTLISDYSVGQTVKQGDVVAYNGFHFVRDFFNPSQVVFKSATLARTCLMESNDTEEDSTAISTRLAGEMTTVVTKTRVLIIPFEDTVEGLIKIGEQVTGDSILCTLVNAVFSDNNMFEENVLETLGHLARNAPKAKYPGVVKHMELLYYGDPESTTVSPSVRQLITHFDSLRLQQAERLQDGRAVTGRVLDSIRVDGTLLPMNHIALKIYIENTDGMAAGDKIVVSNIAHVI